jgi:RNA polymerase sigma-70 factor (ECF subfamily)
MFVTGGGAWQAGAVDDAACDPIPEGPTRERPDRSEAPTLAMHPRNASLDDLVDQAKAGEHRAFEELVRRTASDTFTLARRLVSDDDDARDVVQEVYLRAFRSIGRFRGDAQFTTWLYRITANCAATQLGKRRRHGHDELDTDVELPDAKADHDPALAADASLLRRRLEEAIAELPPRLRAVVVLRDVYDLNHAEIAAELGISESAAKVRLHRARRRLRTLVFPLAGEAAPLVVEEHAHAV